MQLFLMATKNQQTLFRMMSNLMTKILNANRQHQNKITTFGRVLSTFITQRNELHL